MKSICNMSSQAIVPELDCHLADDSERVAAFGNAHEWWGEERKDSVVHSRASWYVGCVDGRMAGLPQQWGSTRSWCVSEGIRVLGAGLGVYIPCQNSDDGAMRQN